MESSPSKPAGNPKGLPAGQGSRKTNPHLQPPDGSKSNTDQNQSRDQGILENASLLHLKSIDIKQDISAEVDTVLSDPTQINQVLINLCTNAAHAMGQKGGILEVCLDNRRPDAVEVPEYLPLHAEKYIRLTVRDTGHGIDRKIMDRIFDPFFMTKDVGKGTGMGLAIVHGIVKNHGGHISVKSEPGKGTNFEVFFPVFKGEAEHEEEDRREVPRGMETVLLVDDEQTILGAIQPTLERLGYKVVSIGSSLKALELFRENPETFDIVITDQTMPAMTGVDLAKELIRSRPGIPIILCTGFSDVIDENKAKDLGIRAYITKPILLKDIAEKIRQVLDTRHLTADDEPTDPSNPTA